MNALAPWLQTQLSTLMHRPGHAWLLHGPSGLGQYELGLALARTWLCVQPTAEGACGVCESCHGIDVRAHADLCVLMPETDLMSLSWPLSEKALKDLEDKKRKPSREIRVDTMREMLAFTQTTAASPHGKVVLIYPAERMNIFTANTLLKTLEEPPGPTRFILACQAAHDLLPTVRSRCQQHAMQWPEASQAITWLVGQGLAKQDAEVMFKAAGGRPEEALWMFNAGLTAQVWRALPAQITRGDAPALAQQPATRVLDCLQKLCHDMLCQAVGAPPRFFAAQDLPKVPSFQKLSNWSRELMQAAKTADHPYHAGLLWDAWCSRARRALTP